MELFGKLKQSCFVSIGLKKIYFKATRGWGFPSIQVIRKVKII